MDTNKIITEELIINRLRKINVLEDDGLDQDYKFQCIQKHYDFTITDDWGSPDIMFYSETTADGYEIWIATDDDRRPSITDDIYYYDNDWLEKMPQAMYDGVSIYYENLNDDDYAFQDVINEVYNDYFDEKREEIIEQLEQEGYEYETEEARVA